MPSDERVLIPIDPSEELPEVVIRHGDAARIYTYKGFRYSLESTNSLVDLIKHRGSKGNTIVLYTDTEIKVILNDAVVDREQDTASYLYQESQELHEWRGILGRPQVQKDLVDYLKRLPNGQIATEYVDNLIGAIQTLKLATEIVGEYSYADNNNIGVMFKTKDGEAQTYIPKQIEVAIPLLNEGDTFTVEIEIELRKPTSEKERPLLVLTCPKLVRYLKEATEREVAKLKKALAGYIVLAGS